MTCSEEGVVALLAGELSSVERAALDDHLLACAECWRAVQEDRAGRLALEPLRDPAPAGLADRIRLAVELAAGAAGGVSGVGDLAPAQHSRAAGPRGAMLHRGPARRGLALLAAACVLVAGLAGGLVEALRPGGATSDPAVVSAITSMATASSGPPVRLAATHRSEHMVLDGQAVVLTAYRVHGVLTMVAVSSRPFAMPPSSRVMHGSTATAWMASRGAVGLWCVNAPSGKHSMLVAAEMPVEQLPAAVAHLPAESL